MGNRQEAGTPEPPFMRSPAPRHFENKGGQNEVMLEWKCAQVPLFGTTFWLKFLS